MMTLLLHTDRARKIEGMSATLEHAVITGDGKISIKFRCHDHASDEWKDVCIRCTQAEWNDIDEHVRHALGSLYRE